MLQIIAAVVFGLFTMLTVNGVANAADCSTDLDCAAHGYADAYGVTPQKMLDAGYIAYQVSDNMYDPIADCLIAGGYTGVPGDGREAIYAPQSAITRCTTFSL